MNALQTTVFASGVFVLTACSHLAIEHSDSKVVVKGGGSALLYSAQDVIERTNQVAAFACRSRPVEIELLKTREAGHSAAVETLSFPITTS